MKNLIFPPFLHQGDKVIILSPSGKIDKRLRAGARQRLESWGLKLVIGSHAGHSHAAYPASIAQRTSDLQQALDDEEAKAILCSRGGYGAVHLIDKLDFERFSRYPKWLIGFSDITVLHNLMQRQGFASLHAPMARHLAMEADDDFCTRAMKDILFGRFTAGEADVLACCDTGFAYTCPAHRLNHKGNADGVLRGGNLAVMYGLRGTPWDIPPEGSILFIEDVGERPHSVERMLYNLKLGGILNRLSGLIIGQFTEYEEKQQLGQELYGVIADLLKEYDYPVCFNFPVGHVTMNLPLVNGAAVTLESGKKEVKLTFHLNRHEESLQE